MSIGYHSRKYQEAKKAREAAMESGDPAFVDAVEEDGQELSEVAPDVVATAPAVGGGQMVTLTYEQLLSLMAAAKPDMSGIASAIAEGTSKNKMPENKTAPKVSHYNPTGEDRPALKCLMYQGGFPLGRGQTTPNLTVNEVHALNTLEPGHFKIRKMDGSDVVVTIRARLDANLRAERLYILYPEGDDQKNLYPSIIDFCAQCVEANRVDMPVMV